MIQEHKTYMNTLVTSLTASVPDLITVERKKEGLFSKNSFVSNLQVDLSPFLYVLELHSKKGIIASKSKVIKDIRIKTEEMSLERWIEEMLQGLKEYAQKNKQIRFAIDDFLFFQ